MQFDPIMYMYAINATIKMILSLFFILYCSYDNHYGEPGQPMVTDEHDEADQRDEADQPNVDDLSDLSVDQQLPVRMAQVTSTPGRSLVPQVLLDISVISDDKSESE